MPDSSAVSFVPSDLPVLKTPSGREIIYQATNPQRPPVSTGRNGSINTIGMTLDIERVGETQLLLSPITSTVGLMVAGS